MTPRIRIVAPDTLPPTVALVNLAWEEGSLRPSLEFQDEACVGSLFLCIRGRETTLAGRLLPARLSETFHPHTSLERGHAFCFTEEGAEVRAVKWFEHSQGWNPGFPEACLLSVFGGRRGLSMKYQNPTIFLGRSSVPNRSCRHLPNAGEFWGVRPGLPRKPLWSLPSGPGY